jgi:hypothetical protein
MKILAAVLASLFQGIIAGVVIGFHDGPSWAVAATMIIVAHVWLLSYRANTEGT